MLHSLLLRRLLQDKVGNNRCGLKCFLLLTLGGFIIVIIAMMVGSRISARKLDYVDTDFEDDTLVVLFWNGIHDIPSEWFRVIKGAIHIGPGGHRTCPSRSTQNSSKNHTNVTQEIAKCFFTTDRSLVTRADAIVICGQHDNRLDHSELPAYRHPDQLYIFYSAETPFHHLKTKKEYGGWLNAFNWTFTYKRDSDVPLPYGTVEKVSKQEAAAAAEAYAKSVEAIKFKNSSIAAIITHCTFKLHRMRMISQLQDAGLKVDIYGQNGNQEDICPLKWSQDCRPLLAKRYWFYLAFENSLCQDYVTEKLYETLQEAMVPIVFGEANYSQAAPPNSVIEVTLSSNVPNTTDRTPEGGFSLLEHHGRKLTAHQVADLVHILQKDETLYARYFEWKKNYKVLQKNDEGCTLCREVVKWKRSGKPRKTYKDIHEWWEPPGVCTTD